MGAWRNRPRSLTSTASPGSLQRRRHRARGNHRRIGAKIFKKCAPSPQRCRRTLRTLSSVALRSPPSRAHALIIFPLARICTPTTEETRRKKNDWHFSRDLIGPLPFLARTALAVTRRNARRTSMEAGGLDDRGAPPRSTNSSSYEERPPFPCLQLSIRRRSQRVAGGSLRRRYFARFVGRRRSSAVPRLRA